MKQIPLSSLRLIHFNFFCITPSFSSNPLEVCTCSEACKSMDHNCNHIKMGLLFLQESFQKHKICCCSCTLFMHIVTDDRFAVVAAGFMGPLPICLPAAIKVGREAIKDRSAHAVNS